MYVDFLNSEAEIYTALDMLTLSRTLLKAQQFQRTVEAYTTGYQEVCRLSL